jgi:PAS domain S-box-containing protein
MSPWIIQFSVRHSHFPPFYDLQRFRERPLVEGALLAIVHRARRHSASIRVRGHHIVIRLTSFSHRWPRRLVPIVIGLVVVLITIFSWQGLRDANDRAIERTTDAQSEAVRLTVEARIGNRLRAINRMGEQWESRGGLTKEQWQYEAGLNIRDFPGFEALEWVDESNQVRWIVPLQGNERFINTNLNQEPRRLAALEEARAQKTMTITPPLELVQGEQGFLVYRPLFRDTRFDGFIVGVFRMDSLFPTVLDKSMAPGYSIQVSDNGEVLYTRATDSSDTPGRWAHDDIIEMSGHTWNVRVWPNDATLSVQDSPLPDVVLAGGCLMSVLLAVSAFLGQTAYSRARDAEELNDALEGEVIERTYAENLQRHQATLLEAQGDAALDAVIVVGEDQRILYHNQRTADLLGVDEAVLATHSISALREATQVLWEDPDTLAATAAYLYDHPSEERRAEVFLTDGRVLEEYSGPVRQPDGTYYGRIWCYRDITDRVRAEQELGLSAEQLRRSNRELEEFAYIVAHDLKAPLVSLKGMMSILVEDYASQLDEQATLYIDRITANASKMEHLLSDLLELSRIGRVDADVEAVDLRSVVQEVLDQLDQMLVQRGATVTGADTLPVVAANRAHLLQLFTNLIDNAVKYTPADRCPTIEIHSEERGEEWELSVADNGVGIPVVFQEKVFGVFQRLPEGKALNPNGTGIGLATVSRIIEKFGGRLWVESQEGIGTTIHFTLPKGDFLTTTDSHRPARREPVVNP